MSPVGAPTTHQVMAVCGPVSKKETRPREGAGAGQVCTWPLFHWGLEPPNAGPAVRPPTE